MTENETPEAKVQAEFHRLGKNIREAVEAAWGSEDRKRVSQQIESGLNEVGDVISQSAQEFTESDSAQRIREDIEDISERIKSGEVARKLEADLITILQSVNVEIEKATEKSSSSTSAEEPEAEGE
jgi:DNA-binding transcriptional regulator GbsR (MarR family)